MHIFNVTDAWPVLRVNQVALHATICEKYGAEEMRYTGTGPRFYDKNGEYLGRFPKGHGPLITEADEQVYLSLPVLVRE